MIWYPLCYVDKVVIVGQQRSCKRKGRVHRERTPEKGPSLVTARRDVDSGVFDRHPRRGERCQGKFVSFSYNLITMCKMRISFAMKRMQRPPRGHETCFGELIVHCPCKANLVQHPAPLDVMVMQTQTRGLGVRLWMLLSVRINRA
jgi:hypothetical protein